MAEEHKKGLNAELVINDLNECCKSEAVCIQCQKKACVIGYAKECMKEYQREPKKMVLEGTKNIPALDYKTFDEANLETAIAHILKECKDCKEDHVEDCIINVIRNCYEVGLLGEVQPYEGSSLQYLVHLNSHFPDKAAHVAETYRNLNEL